MVRWIDGFYGGMLAGVTSAGFYTAAGALWLHDIGPAEFFAQVARGLPPLHAAAGSWALTGLGVVLYVLLAAAFGVLYASLARRTRSMWRAPGSVAWGMCYGLLVWWAINDVLVPVSGAIDLQPLWETLAGTVIFYGIVLSEAMTLARRRAEAALPPAP
jgi:hypothetical protein